MSRNSKLTPQEKEQAAIDYIERDKSGIQIRNRKDVKLGKLRYDRNFYASAPNQKGSTDVTEFKVPGEKKKLYLSAILDLYDRYPVSYAISCRNDNNLVLKMFEKTMTANPDAKPIFHMAEDFNIQAKHFRENWNNPCQELGIVLIINQQKDFGE